MSNKKCDRPQGDEVKKPDEFDIVSKIGAWVSQNITSHLAPVKAELQKEIEERMDDVNFIIDQHTKDIKDLKDFQKLLDAQLATVIKTVAIMGTIFTLINLAIKFMGK